MTVVLSWLVPGTLRLTPMVGVSSVEHVERARAGIRSRLSPAEMQLLYAGRMARERKERRPG